MNPALLRIYHSLPLPLRSLAASARGRQLRRWRYGADSERLVQEALEREQWSAAQWQEWRTARLALVLERAARRVPYYREMWAQRRRKGERASWQYLENWPVLEKQTLRAQAPAFVADDCTRPKMFHDHTSGTTGTSLDIWLSRATVQRWYALFEARSRRWYGVSRYDHWGLLGGQLVTPATQTRPPFWVWNSALNQLYLSAYHLAPAWAGSYLEALQHYRIRYLVGYPSALYYLAREAQRLGQTGVRLTVVIANAEPLLAHQRAAISDAFQCPVRETYGMAEIAAAASECEHGKLHQWPEAGLVETLGADGANHETSGDFICTGLLNADMPLIRYRIGDSGAWAPPSFPPGPESNRRATRAVMPAPLPKRAVARRTISPPTHRGRCMRSRKFSGTRTIPSARPIFIWIGPSTVRPRLRACVCF